MTDNVILKVDGCILPWLCLVCLTLPLITYLSFLFPGGRIYPVLTQILWSSRRSWSQLMSADDSITPRQERSSEHPSEELPPVSCQELLIKPRTTQNWSRSVNMWMTVLIISDFSNILAELRGIDCTLYIQSVSCTPCSVSIAPCNVVIFGALSNYRTDRNVCQTELNCFLPQYQCQWGYCGRQNVLMKFKFNWLHVRILMVYFYLLSLKKSLKGSIIFCFLAESLGKITSRTCIKFLPYTLEAILALEETSRWKSALC